MKRGRAESLQKQKIENKKEVGKNE